MAHACLSYLKKEYPRAKMELKFNNNIQLLVVVILSAQCTDKKVNEVTAKLFFPKGEKKYKTVDDFANANQSVLEKEIYSTGFYRAKARHIIAAARMIKNEFEGVLPRTIVEMMRIPGVARKTANVLLGNAFGVVEGIAVDTHVKRFARVCGLSNSDNQVKIEQDLMKITPRKDWFLLTYLFIEYGRQVCPARKHDCADHPLTKIYPAAADSWPKAKS